MRRAPAVASVLLALAWLGCVRPAGYETPQASTELKVAVQNHNFYEATLYALSSTRRIRIGSVGGHRSRDFVIDWTDLDIRIEVRLTAVGSYVTESLTVSRGDGVELIIQPDAHLRAR